MRAERDVYREALYAIACKPEPRTRSAMISVAEAALLKGMKMRTEMMKGRAA